MYALDTNSVIYFFKGLGREGTPIGSIDVLVAGTALSHGAVLVTHNVREFGRVEGLTVEDWY